MSAPQTDASGKPTLEQMQAHARALLDGITNAADRLLRVVWVENLTRSTSGAPMLPLHFVAEQGRTVVLLDVRSQAEVVGPVGHIPGAFWLPEERLDEAVKALPPNTPTVVVSRVGEVAATLAQRLEAAGLKMAAAMAGGMLAWKAAGFATSRDPAVLSRPVEAPAAPADVPEGAAVLGRAHIEEHVGNAASVRWVKMAMFLMQGKESCVDGRDAKGVIGTAGGDAGEFLLLMAATEKHRNMMFTDAEVLALLRDYVDTFGSFYMHSDVGTFNRLIKALRADNRLDQALADVDTALQWRAFMRDPLEAIRPTLLEHLVVPDHVGCGHLKLMCKNPEIYGVRAQLSAAFIRAFFLMRWEGSDELDLVTLTDAHREGAVVNVTLDKPVQSFTRVPLISPAYGSVQMFVNHPQVSTFLREQRAHWMVQHGTVWGLDFFDQEPLLQTIQELARAGLGHTLSVLARDLPVYTVHFVGEKEFSVAMMPPAATA